MSGRARASHRTAPRWWCHLLWAITVGLCACGEGSGPPTASITVYAPEGPLLAGQAFELKVERRFDPSLAPIPQPSETLGPLVLVEAGRRRAVEAGQIVETTTWRAHAFEPGPLTIPAQRMSARKKGDGSIVEALSEPRRMEVVETLPPEASLDMEGLGSAPAWPRPWPAERFWLLSALSLVVGGVVLWRGRPQRVASAAEIAPQADPFDAACESLSALRAAIGQRPARDLQAAVQAIVRERCGALCAIDAACLATSELCTWTRQAALALPATEACLRGLDRQRFARPESAERELFAAIAMAEAALAELRAARDAHLLLSHAESRA